MADSMVVKLIKRISTKEEYEQAQQALNMKRFDLFIPETTVYEKSSQSELVYGIATINRIRPRYLQGLKVEVKKINHKSYVVDMPNRPEFQTWAGRKNVRVPKSSCTYQPYTHPKKENITA